jgi:hypothetical protein
VSRRLLPRQRLCVDPLAVVVDDQAEVPRLIVDRDDDARACACLTALRSASLAIRYASSRTTGFRSRDAPSISTSIAGASTTAGSPVSSAPIAAIPFARSFTVVADARSPPTALRPSDQRLSSGSAVLDRRPRRRTQPV